MALGRCSSKAYQAHTQSPLRGLLISHDMIKWYIIRLTGAVLYHLFVSYLSKVRVMTPLFLYCMLWIPPPLCIPCCVLHTEKNNLPISSIGFCCWLCAYRHCCYIILCLGMCHPDRHHCCYVRTYCLLCTATWCLWTLPPLYIHTASLCLLVLPHVWILSLVCCGVLLTLYTLCYALQVLPYEWVQPSLYIVCYVL